MVNPMMNIFMTLGEAGPKPKEEILKVPVY